METTYGISIAIVDRAPIDAGPPPVEEPHSRLYADDGVHSMPDHEEMRRKKYSRARQSSSLKAETYMSTEVEPPGPMRSRSRMHSSRFEPYDRSRIRTRKEPSRSYYEELGAVSPPPSRPYVDPYFDAPYLPADSRYDDDARYHSRPHHPPRRPSDEVGGMDYDGHSRSRSRSPRRRASDSRKARVPIVPEHGNDEARNRRMAKVEIIEKKERDRRRREGPSLRDELQPRPGPTIERRAASYEVPETYRSGVEIRRIDPRDNYMTGARHSDDSDDSHGAAVAVSRPRR